MGWALFDFYVYKFVLHRSLITQILNPFNFDFGIGEIFVFQNRLPAINDAGGLYGNNIFVLAIRQTMVRRVKTPRIIYS
jgi:hypothetical protein